MERRYYSAFSPVKIQDMGLRVLLVLFLLFPSLQGCAKRYSSVYQHPVMGTFSRISVRGKVSGEVIQECFSEMDRIEREFSKFLPESQIYRINSSSGRPVRVSGECIRLIKIAKEFSRITGGAFDITAVKGVKNSVWSWKDVEVKSPYIILRKKGMRIDLGGIAKGYAVDRVADVLRREKVSSAVIDIGGNLYLLGRKRGRWSVGIRNPLNPSTLIGRFYVDGNNGVATSGNYEQPGHIIDPSTGHSVTGPVLSVTVIAKDATTADALSTAIFVSGVKKGIKIIKELDVDAVIVASGKDKKPVIYITKRMARDYESFYRYPVRYL